MLEAKAKDLALQRLRAQLADRGLPMRNGRLELRSTVARSGQTPPSCTPSDR